MPVDYHREESRIRSVYGRRDSSGKGSLYAWHNQGALLNQYRFQAVAAALLSAEGLADLSLLDMLDIGCGTGGWLRKLMEWGASPELLHGIDLLQDRIERARVLCPTIDFKVGSGFELPYPSHSMDLVTAHTVFSSILDVSARKALAEEMVRVLKPTGCAFVYDYRISDPRNPDTVGIRKKEIQRLFPGFDLAMRSLTLAPPLGRRIAPLSPLLAHALEVCFPFLRTHAACLLIRGARM